MDHWIYQSPLGPLQLHVHDGRLRRVVPGPSDPLRGPSWSGNRPDGVDVWNDWMDRYFAARPMRIAPERLDLGSVTPFRRTVYEVIREIGFGQTMSYGEVAGKVGRPKGARAVGQAAAANPLPVVIPCHRIVRSNGECGGYVAGTPWKRRLLELEQMARIS